MSIAYVVALKPDVAFACEATLDGAEEHRVDEATAEPIRNVAPHDAVLYRVIPSVNQTVV